VRYGSRAKCDPKAVSRGHVVLPTPYTLYLTPYTLHPKLNTMNLGLSLDPIPYTLHPEGATMEGGAQGGEDAALRRRPSRPCPEVGFR